MNKIDKQLDETLSLTADYLRKNGYLIHVIRYSGGFDKPGITLVGIDIQQKVINCLLIGGFNDFEVDSITTVYDGNIIALHTRVTFLHQEQIREIKTTGADKNVYGCV